MKMEITTTINYKYLMNKSKHELAYMILDFLDDLEEKETEIKRLNSMMISLNIFSDEDK